MGAKAASSYQEDGSYFYTCRKDGVERKFMIFSDGEQPNSSKIYEQETSKRNGVIVSVPIKSGDQFEFINSIKQQLSYFSNVYFENCNIQNNFKIYRHELFQYSELYNLDNLHLTLDDVCYPIDFQKLGIPLINVKIALRFSLTDGLAVIPNRENIEYTKESRAIIIKRIEDVAEHLIDVYNDSCSIFETPEALFEYFDFNKKNIIEIVPGVKVDIKPFESHSTISFNPPTLKGVSKLNPYTIWHNKNKIFTLYKVTSKISNGRFQKEIANAWSYSPQNLYNYAAKKGNSYWTPIIYKELPVGKKLLYLKEQFPNAGLFRKHKNWKLKNKGINEEHILFSLLSLSSYNKKDWRQVIKDWLYVVDYFESKIVKEENIVVPLSWIEANKKKRVLNKKLEGEVNFRFARLAEKSSATKCIFDSELLNLKDSKIKNKLIIYGNEENKEKLSQLFLLNKNKNIRVSLLGKNDYKKLKDIQHHNFMDIKDMESTYNRVILRHVTAKRVADYVAKYELIFKYKSHVKEFNKAFHQDLVDLVVYKETHYSESGQSHAGSLLEACVKLCEEKGWKDHNIEAIINRVSQSIDKLNVIPFFSSGNYWSDALKDGSLPIIREVLVARKFKMDFVPPPVIVQDETPIATDEPEPELLEELIEEDTI